MRCESPPPARDNATKAASRANNPAMDTMTIDKISPKAVNTLMALKRTSPRANSVEVQSSFCCARNALRSKSGGKQKTMEDCVLPTVSK